MDIRNLTKYFLEGAAVSTAAYYLTSKKTNLKSVFMLGLVASITFLILDQFAPNVAAGARLGSGFGIGYGLVGGKSSVSPLLPRPPAPLLTTFKEIDNEVNKLIEDNPYNDPKSDQNLDSALRDYNNIALDAIKRDAKEYFKQRLRDEKVKVIPMDDYTPSYPGQGPYYEAYRDSVTVNNINSNLFDEISKYRALILLGYAMLKKKLNTNKLTQKEFNDKLALSPGIIKTKNVLKKFLNKYYPEGEYYDKIYPYAYPDNPNK